MLDHRHGALLRLYHQGDQVGAAQGDEGLAAVQQGRRVEQYHFTRLGRFAADPHAHAVFLQQAAQLLDDEGHAFTVARRGQAQGQALFLDARVGQQPVQPVDAGGEGVAALRGAVAQLRQGGPQRQAEFLLDQAAVVDALVEQVAEIDHQQADGEAEGHGEEQHQQGFREDPPGVVGGFLDHRDVADLALVQFTVDPRFLQAVDVQRVVALGGVQLALQARQGRLDVQRFAPLRLEFGELLFLLRELGAQGRVVAGLVQQDPFQVSGQGVRRAVLGTLHGGAFVLDFLLQGTDRGVQGLHRRRIVGVGAHHVGAFQALLVEQPAEVLLRRVQRDLPHRDDLPGQPLELLAGGFQGAVGGGDQADRVETLAAQHVDPLGQVLQAVLDAGCADLVEVLEDLRLVALDLRRAVGSLRLVEGVQALAAERLGALFHVDLDPGLDHFLGDFRLAPGEADLHHRRAGRMGDLEFLLEVLGQALDRGGFLDHAEGFQGHANPVEHRADGLLHIELGALPQALRRRPVGQHLEVALGHLADDRSAGEQAFFVDDRVALGARHHQRLAVADLDRQGRVTARLDQQACVGLVLGRQQEGAEDDDHHRAEGRQLELALVDEQQAQQITQGTNFYHGDVAPQRSLLTV